MFIPPAAFSSCRVSELLAACDGVLPSIPPSADSHVSLSSPSGCRKDLPRGKRLMATAKAEQFSWRGAGVGMAPVGQKPCGSHGEREPLSLIWVMSSTLPNDPCAAAVGSLVLLCSPPARI